MSEPINETATAYSLTCFQVKTSIYEINQPFVLKTVTGQARTSLLLPPLSEENSEEGVR